MSTYKIGLSADKKTVYVARGGDALPAGATVAMTSFKHGETGDGVDVHAANHVLYQDVQDALYRQKGIENMQAISIVTSGSLAAKALTAAALAIVKLATKPIVIKYQPADVSAVNADFTFVSSDVTIATVASTGVVTAVKAGAATITATLKDDPTKTVNVAVTVTDA